MWQTCGMFASCQRSDDKDLKRCAFAACYSITPTNRRGGSRGRAKGAMAPPSDQGAPPKWSRWGTLHAKSAPNLKKIPRRLPQILAWPSPFKKSRSASESELVLFQNENAWAFTPLPRFPNCTDLLPKSPFFVMDWEIHTNSLCDVMMSYHDLTWCHDIILRRHMKSHHRAKWFHMGIPFRQKPQNHISDLVTLTYNPSLAKVMVNSYTKNQGHKSNGSAVRVLTHTQTHIHTQSAPILWPRLLTREVTRMSRT